MFRAEKQVIFLARKTIKCVRLSLLFHTFVKMPR